MSSEQMQVFSTYEMKIRDNIVDEYQDIFPKGTTNQNCFSSTVENASDLCKLRSARAHPQGGTHLRHSHFAPSPHFRAGYPQPLCTDRCSSSGTRAKVTLPTTRDQDTNMLEITNCPVCRQPSIETVQRTKGVIVTADSICDNAHLWVTRWLLPTAGPIPDQEAS